MSGGRNAQWTEIQKITVDKTSADRTFDLCRQNAFVTSAKNMENAQQNIACIT